MKVSQGGEITVCEKETGANFLMTLTVKTSTLVIGPSSRLPPFNACGPSAARDEDGNENHMTASIDKRQLSYPLPSEQFVYAPISALRLLSGPPRWI